MVATRHVRARALAYEASGQFAEVDDEVVTRILRLASEWPRLAVRRTCRRFHELVPRLRSNLVGDTIAAFSVWTAEAWLRNLERDGRWMRCARPPDDVTAFSAASALGHEVVAAAACSTSRRAGVLSYNPRTNAWRRLPSLPFDHCQWLAALDERRLVAAGEHTNNLALFDGTRWASIPSPFRGTTFNFAFGTSGDKLYIGLPENNGRTVRFRIYDHAAKTWADGPAWTAGDAIFEWIVADGVLDWVTRGHPMCSAFENVDGPPTRRRGKRRKGVPARVTLLVDRIIFPSLLYAPHNAWTPAEDGSAKWLVHPRPSRGPPYQNLQKERHCIATFAAPE